MLYLCIIGNALVHRDYSRLGAVHVRHVKITPDLPSSLLFTCSRRAGISSFFVSSLPGPAFAGSKVRLVDGNDREAVYKTVGNAVAKARKGDGPAGRPDKVNRYSRVRIIESTPSRVAASSIRPVPDEPAPTAHAGVPWRYGASSAATVRYR